MSRSILAGAAVCSLLIAAAPATAARPAAHSPGRFGPAPAAFIPPPAPPLTLAQGRWFVARTIRPFAPGARGLSCWRLAPATVACAFWHRTGLWERSGPVRRAVELAELDTPSQHVRVTLAGAVPLTPAERQALGYG